MFLLFLSTMYLFARAATTKHCTTSSLKIAESYSLKVTADRDLKDVRRNDTFTDLQGNLPQTCPLGS